MCSKVFALLLVNVLVLSVQGAPLRGGNTLGMCERSYCECEPASHPAWRIARCTLEDDQTISIFENDVEENIIDLNINGGLSVDMYSYAFKHNHDVRSVRFNGTGTVTLMSHSFYDSTTVNTKLYVTRSKAVNIQSVAFKYLSGTISLELYNCDQASIGKQAFSWIRSVEITNVGYLSLADGVFTQDPNRPSFKEHGPDFVIVLTNVTMREIPSGTFGSSAAEIRLDGVNVGVMRKNAFNANSYDLVSILRSKFQLIEAGSFAQKTLINKLEWDESFVKELHSDAVLSAMTNFTVQHSRLEFIAPGAINITVATVILLSNEFENFFEGGFELHAWNNLQVNGNSFNEMEPRAIIAPFTYTSGLSKYSFSFVDNEMVNLKPNSLKFVGDLLDNGHLAVTYKNNYFAQICYCDIVNWLASVLGIQTVSAASATSHCTVDDFFAVCFKIPKENMLIDRFTRDVCEVESNITCPPYTTKLDGVTKEIINTRYPHRRNKTDDYKFNDRNMYVIKIMVLVAIIFVLIIIFAWLFTIIKVKNCCMRLKIAVISWNTFCAVCIDLLGAFGLVRAAPVNAGSISRISVYEYSERHRLNEPLAHLQGFQSIPTDVYGLGETVTFDKATQTLPEHLSHELIETLKLQLDDPNDCNEAREVIEHLYELIKAEENCNHEQTGTRSFTEYENIYDLPLTKNVVYVGNNKKEMISVGTQAPPLDQPLPLVDDNGTTPLCNEYFVPMDMAIHLYAEISNYDREKKGNCSQAPSVIEQPKLRGPYLRAMREKKSDSPKPFAESFEMTANPHLNTARSNKSTASNSSTKMQNRPLPEKPTTIDHIEGASSQVR